MEIQFYPKKCFVVLNSPKTVKCNRLIYHALTFFPKGRLSFVKKKSQLMIKMQLYWSVPTLCNSQIGAPSYWESLILFGSNWPESLLEEHSSKWFIIGFPKSIFWENNAFLFIYFSFCWPLGFKFSRITSLIPFMLTSADPSLKRINYFFHFV